MVAKEVLRVAADLLLELLARLGADFDGVGGRARPGVVNGLGIWWRKLGLRGTNVNEVTSQALTDMGRAPTFYDCAVEVQRLD